LILSHKIEGDPSPVNTELCSDWLTNNWPSFQAGYCDAVATCGGGGQLGHLQLFT